jgi:hypothetical protein
MAIMSLMVVCEVEQAGKVRAVLEGKGIREKLEQLQAVD